MDVVGSEIGQKMRSAIKAKLTELGCYVDDELPDYVMVMVANKRTRTQMEDDLQLFLSDNTNLFVNWLHQVLKKLQEVTIAAPIKTVEPTQTKERSKSKERKSKEKKLKHKEKSKKSEHAKKAKKKEKEKSQRKKGEKTLKSKKKSKVEKEGHIRPNIPPLLMNMEKESEPSITDAFAGQILKNHGVTTVEMSKIEPIKENEPVLIDKRPILPIIDPDTILTQSEPTGSVTETTTADISKNDKEEIQELIDIEAKIVGFKQKINETSDVMSDDEDFLNIRTEAEELMNDFVEDQEICQPTPTVSSPPNNSSSPVVTTCPKEDSKQTEETLLQIELQLPKRPIRERIGLKEEPKKFFEDEKVSQRTTSPERFTPEREPEPKKPAKERLGEMAQRKRSVSDSSDKSDTVLKKERLTSKVSALGSGRACASVVRVRPRPRGPMPNSSLLLRAVADAHKSLLHAPQKSEPESRKVKRALVHPMRRSDDVNIVIQVPMEHSELSCDKHTDEGTEREYAPLSMNKRFHNSDYVPSVRRDSRSATKRDDTVIVETINIHNQTVDKEQKTQFIVTMDGYHPNAFLAKKLMTEGLLDDDGKVLDQPKNKDTGPPPTEEVKNEAVPVTEKQTTYKQTEKTKCLFDKQTEKAEQKSPSSAIKKRLSDTSEESDTQVIVKPESVKRNSVDISENKEIRTVKKRKASPIVFDVKKENESKNKVQNKSRERTESVSSDNHVTITTTVNSHKYDAVPSLSQAERAPVSTLSTPCRSFPLCRFGASCAFQHPRCKFAASCTRRGCVYDHSKTPAGQPPSVASHVVPAANYKSIPTVSVASQMCKFYPNCVNPTCHYFHPKPCRYGAACVNKLVCNFYHPNVLY